MNDNPHLMAIIDSKLAQARSSLQNNRPDVAGDLLAQTQIYAAALATGGSTAGSQPRIA